MARTNLFTLVVLLMVAMVSRQLAVSFFDLASMGEARSAVRDLALAPEAPAAIDFQNAASNAIEERGGQRRAVHIALDALIIVSMLWWLGSRRGASSRPVSTASTTSRIG